MSFSRRPPPVNELQRALQKARLSKPSMGAILRPLGTTATAPHLAIPALFLDKYAPPGWQGKAEATLRRVLPPVVFAPPATTVGHSGASEVEQGPSSACHPLFLRCLVSPSFLPVQAAGGDGEIAELRRRVLAPAALSAVGRTVAQLTADTIAVWGGALPTDATLLELLPTARMVDLLRQWALDEVLLHHPLPPPPHGQTHGHAAGAKEGAFSPQPDLGPEVLARLAPHVVMQLAGAMSLVHGAGVAGDFLSAEVFPHVAAPPPSKLPEQLY